MQEGSNVVTTSLLCAAQRMEASVCRGRQWGVGTPAVTLCEGGSSGRHVRGLRGEYQRSTAQEVIAHDPDPVSTQKGEHECACSEMMVVELNGMRTRWGWGPG